MPPAAFYHTPSGPRVVTIAARDDLQPRVSQSRLSLILPGSILIRDIAFFVRLEEDDLAYAFVDVDAQGEVGEVGELDDEAALPAGFEGRGVDQKAGARVGGLAERDGGDGAGHAEGFDGDAEAVGVRGEQVVARAVVRRAQRWFDQGFFVEAFGVNLAPVYGREDAEAVVGQAHVVAVAGCAGADDAAACDFADELRLEGVYELRLFGHAANPAVGFDCHMCAVRAGTGEMEEPLPPQNARAVQGGMRQHNQRG